jgi:hypothetical protein
MSFSHPEEAEVPSFGACVRELTEVNGSSLQ